MLTKKGCISHQKKRRWTRRTSSHLVLLVVEEQHGDRLDVRHVFEGAQNKVLHTCTMSNMMQETHKGQLNGLVYGRFATGKHGVPQPILGIWTVFSLKSVQFYILGGKNAYLSLAHGRNSRDIIWTMKTLWTTQQSVTTPRAIDKFRWKHQVCPKVQTQTRVGEHHNIPDMFEGATRLINRQNYQCSTQVATIDL